MYVKLVIGKHIVNIVSAYAPQVGLKTLCEVNAKIVNLLFLAKTNRKYTILQ